MQLLETQDAMKPAAKRICFMDVCLGLTPNRSLKLLFQKSKDMRGYRLAGRPVFEVDQPLVQARKREKAGCPWELQGLKSSCRWQRYRTCQNVTYITCLWTLPRNPWKRSLARPANV